MDENSAVWLLLERINKLTERVEQLEKEVYTSRINQQSYYYQPVEIPMHSYREQVYWQWIPSNITINDLYEASNNLSHTDASNVRVMSPEQFEAEWRPDDAITFVTGDTLDWVIWYNG